MTRLIAARFSNCAVSICFWTILVNAKITGINTTRSSASPRFWNQITAKILMTLQASANMLMIPEVNNASTVSTSPTNLDTTAPGSSLFNVSALSRTSFFESSLRNAMSGNFPAAQRGESVRRTGQVSGPRRLAIPGDRKLRYLVCLSDSLVFGICI